MAEKFPNESGFICEIVTAQNIKDCHPPGQWYLPDGIETLQDPVLKITFPPRDLSSALMKNFMSEEVVGESPATVYNKQLENLVDGAGNNVVYFKPSVSLLDNLISAGMASTDEVGSLQKRYQFLNDAAASPVRGSER